MKVKTLGIILVASFVALFLGIWIGGRNEAELEEKINTKGITITNLHKQLDTMSEMNQKLTTEKAGLQRSFEEAQATIEQHNQRALDLQYELDKKTSSLAELDKKVAELQESISELQLRNSQLSDDLALATEAQNKLPQLSEQLQVCSEQSIVLQTALGTCNSSLNNLNAENAKCVEDLNTMKEKCSQQDAPKEPTKQEPNENEEEPNENQEEEPNEQQEEKPQEEKPQEPNENQDIFKEPTENPEEKPQEPAEQQGSKYQSGYTDIFKPQEPTEKIQDPNEFEIGPDNSKMEEEGMKSQLNEENPSATGSVYNQQSQLDENGENSQADEVELKEGGSNEVAAVGAQSYQQKTDDKATEGLNDKFGSKQQQNMFAAESKANVVNAPVEGLQMDELQR